MRDRRHHQQLAKGLELLFGGKNGKPCRLPVQLRPNKPRSEHSTDEEILVPNPDGDVDCPETVPVHLY